MTHPHKIPKESLPPFAFKVLYFFWVNDLPLEWHFDNNDNLSFYVNCNDVFSYATADSEPITPENFPILEQTLKDLTLEDHSAYTIELFASRSREKQVISLPYCESSLQEVKQIGPKPLYTLFKEAPNWKEKHHNDTRRIPSD
jgi:hypothetical protein